MITNGLDSRASFRLQMGGYERVKDEFLVFEKEAMIVIVRTYIIILTDYD